MQVCRVKQTAAIFLPPTLCGQLLTHILISAVLHLRYVYERSMTGVSSK